MEGGCDHHFLTPFPGDPPDPGDPGDPGDPRRIPGGSILLLFTMFLALFPGK